VKNRKRQKKKRRKKIEANNHLKTLSGQKVSTALGNQILGGKK